MDPWRSDHRTLRARACQAWRAMNDAQSLGFKEIFVLTNLGGEAFLPHASISS